MLVLFSRGRDSRDEVDDADILIESTNVKY